MLCYSRRVATRPNSSWYEGDVEVFVAECRCSDSRNQRSNEPGQGRTAWGPRFSMNWSVQPTTYTTGSLVLQRSSALTTGLRIDIMRKVFETSYLTSSLCSLNYRHYGEPQKRVLSKIIVLSMVQFVFLCGLSTETRIKHHKSNW